MNIQQEINWLTKEAEKAEKICKFLESKLTDEYFDDEELRDNETIKAMVWAIRMKFVGEAYKKTYLNSHLKI